MFTKNMSADRIMYKEKRIERNNKTDILSLVTIANSQLYNNNAKTIQLQLLNSNFTIMELQRNTVLQK